MQTPGQVGATTFPHNTQYDGANGAWSVWSQCLQDYRQYAAIHKGQQCNIAFADGSVRAFRDSDGDNYLNNSAFLQNNVTTITCFSPTPATATVPASGFLDALPEVSPSDVFSNWSIQGP